MKYFLCFLFESPMKLSNYQWFLGILYHRLFYVSVGVWGLIGGNLIEAILAIGAYSPGLSPFEYTLRAEYVITRIQLCFKFFLTVYFHQADAASRQLHFDFILNFACIKQILLDCLGVTARLLAYLILDLGLRADLRLLLLLLCQSQPRPGPWWDGMIRIILVAAWLNRLFWWRFWLRLSGPIG